MSADEPKITEEQGSELPEEVSFEQFDLDARIKAALQSLQLQKPTPVQLAAIPEALEGKDLIVSAQTGTGKTLAFVLPVLNRVIGRSGTYALILAPTREIALQTQKVLSDLGASHGVKSVALIGGTPLRTDEALLKEYPQILVATPGRICDHLERGNIWLEYLEMLVLDEADRMLEMGFAEQLNRILSATPDSRQTLLFSATLNTVVEKLANRITYQPLRLKVGKPSRAATTVEQRFVFLDEEAKMRELEHLIYEERGTIFIFVRSKDNAYRLWRSLRNRGYQTVTQLHSDLDQAQREQALQDFKEGRYRMLIATDVVGRGIHVDDVSLVINYDFPRDAEDYIHRIGRTGRAENSGKAISLVTKRDAPVLRDVEKVIGRRIEPERRGEGSKPKPAPKPAAKAQPPGDPLTRGKFIPKQKP